MYTGVILNDDSRNKLKGYFKNIIPNDWEFISHHMTINTGKIRNDLVTFLGKEVELIVYKIGVNELVIAVGVKGFYSDNDEPHITIAVNKKKGGEPVMSNKITNWKKINNEFTVKGIISEIKSDNEITTLNVFDFDGTLFDSPEPEEGKKKWKEVTGTNYPFVGWWGRPESLDSDVFDIKPFVNISNKLNSLKTKNNNRSIILTSRQEKLRPQLMKILRENNIEVDDILMRSGSDKSKGDKILDELEKFPTINRVNVYDDRDVEIQSFKSIIPKLNNGVTLNINLVDRGNVRPIKINETTRIIEIVKDMIKKIL